jgi:hypothetical protein
MSWLVAAAVVGRAPLLLQLAKCSGSNRTDATTYDRAVRRAITVVTVLCVAAGPVLAGCSTRSEDSGGTGAGPSATGLRQALSRVAATDDTRAWVGYNAIAELTKVVGKRPGRGFGLLLLHGTGIKTVVAQHAPADTGIAPLDADYGIAAGQPPHTVTVLAGGQRADRIGTSLTTLGWARNGDRYVGPDPARLTDAGRKAVYGLTFAQVRPDGSDVVIGRSGTDLGTAGHPLPGRSLADDQATAALAGCLGDVVVANLTTRYGSRTTQQPAGVPHGVQLDKLTEVAVGVRVPKSASDTPRAVVCTAWADRAAADGYAGAVPGVLADGKSLTAGVPYAQLLTHPQITKVGGDAHVVKWTADEPNADESRLILQMLLNADVPGLG